MPEQFDSIYFRGQGATFLGRKDANGEPTGLKFIGDLGEFTPDASVDRSEVFENVSGQNNIGSSIVIRNNFGFTMSMRSLIAEHLQEIVQGDITTVAASAVTDEPVTGYHDKFAKLPHVNISSVTVTDSPETAPYTVNTDYIVHAEIGMIEILSTGSIADGEALLVDYTPAAQKIVTVNPGNEDLYLFFAGKNSANNDKQTRAEFYKVQLDPGSIPLITDAQVDVPIKGKVLADTVRAAGDQTYRWVVED